MVCYKCVLDFVELPAGSTLTNYTYTLFFFAVDNCNGLFYTSN